METIVSIVSVLIISEGQIMKLEDIKLYMRVDTDADDALITGLIAAAQQYIHETTGLVYDDNNNIHQLVCKLLVAHWYEHREIVGDDKEVPYTATRLLTHIAICQHAGTTTETATTETTTTGTTTGSTTGTTTGTTTTETATTETTTAGTTTETTTTETTTEVKP